MEFWLTIKQAAKRVHRSPDVVRAWVNTGLLPGYQPNGRGSVLVKPKELDEFVERFEVMPPARDRDRKKQAKPEQVVSLKEFIKQEKAEGHY